MAKIEGDPAPKHTPGPWVVSPVYPLEIRTMAKKGDAVKIGLAVGISGSFDLQPEANAKLMAAAPELLARLKDAMELIRVWHGMGVADKGTEKWMWEIYRTMAPEIRPIRELLEKFL